MVVSRGTGGMGHPEFVIIPPKIHQNTPLQAKRIIFGGMGLAPKSLRRWKDTPLSIEA